MPVSISVHAKRAAAAALGACILAAAIQPASAQSRDPLGAFFDLLGGRFTPRPVPPPRLPIPDLPDLPPERGLSITITPSHQLGGGRGSAAYCVRLCDGRYFPMPRTMLSARATPAKLCSVLCPASATRIYRGPSIDAAMDSGGRSYRDLNSAFRFREVTDLDCTCNGRDIFGIAAVDINADLTLRAGDIVVTDAGFMVFQRWRKDAQQTGEFVPITNPDLLAKIKRMPIGQALRK